jgi:hypothetical protein
VDQIAHVRLTAVGEYRFHHEVDNEVGGKGVQGNPPPPLGNALEVEPCTSPIYLADWIKHAMRPGGRTVLYK